MRKNTGKSTPKKLIKELAQKYGHSCHFMLVLEVPMKEVVSFFEKALTEFHQRTDATSGVPLRESVDDLEQSEKAIRSMWAALEEDQMPSPCSITLHDEPPDLSREKPTASLDFLD